jgi:hypothetical protein
MIEQLSEMQIRIHTLREPVLNEGSVTSVKKDRITIPEVKIEVLWHLDRLAAAVAGARWHMSTVEHDDSFKRTDKERMRTRIVEILHQDLGWLPATVKDLDLQDLSTWDLLEHRDADERQPPLNGHAREDALKEQQIVSETFHQLAMLKDEVADMLQMLGADVT